MQAISKGPVLARLRAAFRDPGRDDVVVPLFFSRQLDQIDRARAPGADGLDPSAGAQVVKCPNGPGNDRNRGPVG